MTHLADETRLCWQAVTELRACHASTEERRLRRDEVEALASVTDRPALKRLCQNALRATDIGCLEADFGSTVVGFTASLAGR
jgi:hypothetical protein